MMLLTHQKNKKQKQAVGIGVQFVNRYQYVWLELGIGVQFVNRYQYVWLELWIDSKLCFVVNIKELM